MAEETPATSPTEQSAASAGQKAGDAPAGKKDVVEPGDVSATPAEIAPDSGTATAAKPAAKPQKLPEGQHWWWGIGRRKAAVARVRLRPGSGEFKVNKRDLDQYFTEDRDRKDIRTVLEKTNTTGQVDVVVNVKGGGFMGQAGAVVLGLGRALKEYDPTLEPILRANHFLTRDAREVERKKPGQKGARGRFQFSKR